MKKLTAKKLVLLAAILIIAIGIGGSIILYKRGLDGEHIAILWIVYLVAIIGLLDLIFLIIIPIIKRMKEKDDPPPEFSNRTSPTYRV